jgi:energy-coupling factor transporter ATP-binding protein EcfA2
VRTLLSQYDIAHADMSTKLKFAAGFAPAESVAEQLVAAAHAPHLADFDFARSEICRSPRSAARARRAEAEIEQAWTVEGGGDDAHSFSTASSLRPAKPATSTPVEPPIQFSGGRNALTAAREHFRLARHPFVDDVQGPQDVYLSRDQRYIRETMYYAAKHAGFVAIVGESGSGKTTLRRDLLDRIRRENDSIVIIQPQTVDKTVLSAAHICDAIIADLSSEAPKLAGSEGPPGAAHSRHRRATESLALPDHRRGARPGHRHAQVPQALLGNGGRFQEAARHHPGRPARTRHAPGRAEESRRARSDSPHRSGQAQEPERQPGGIPRAEVQAHRFLLDDVFDKDAFDAIRARLTRRRANNEIESHLYPLVVHNVCIKAMNQAVELGLPKVNAKLVEKV